MEIQRYEIGTGRPDPNGAVVRYTDYLAKVAELERDATLTAQCQEENLEHIAMLERQVAALKAPVTDEELTPHLLGKKWPITEAFDALLKARARKAGCDE